MTYSNIVVYARAAHQHVAAEAFIKGLEAHGQSAYLETSHSVTMGDLVVVWSARWDWLFTSINAAESDYLIMEAGFLQDGITGTGQVYAGQRLQNVSLGFNGLNGRADFRNKNSPPDRAQSWTHKLKPWRSTPGNYILLLGQVEGDASTRGVDLGEYYRRILATDYGLPVRYRPHPLYEEQSCSLAEDLQNAHMAVTWNSNAAVEAVLSGVPTIIEDEGSMAYPMRYREDNPCPDRWQWLCDLAYAQWTLDEIRSGEAWQHLTTTR